MEEEKISFPAHIRNYLDRIHAPGEREFTFRGTSPEEFEEWRNGARPALRELIGLNRIEREANGFESEPKFEVEESCRDFTRYYGTFETEPEVPLPFRMLRPAGPGPFPLAIVSHGHEHGGHEIIAGVIRNEYARAQIEEERQDIGIQAVKRGFFTIMPSTRGLGSFGVPDILRTFGGRNCRSHLINALAAGRTCIGERVWDFSRFIDWAELQPEIETHGLLMIGNSGGGVLTLYAAACDTRIRRAVSNSAFILFVQPTGQLSHCPCNTVPGILRFGEFYDVAGLIAPRHLLCIRGRADKPRLLPSFKTACNALARIYEAANAPARLACLIGEGGHRYYPELFWPWADNT